MKQRVILFAWLITSNCVAVESPQDGVGPSRADHPMSILVGGGACDVADFLQAEAWQGRRLPNTAENVIVRCSAKLAKKARFTRELGSLTVEGPAVLQVNSKVMLRGDVHVDGRVESYNAAMVIGGEFSVGSKEGAAAFMLSLADDNPFPLLDCASMELAGTSAIEMVWWYSPPPEAPGNSIPVIRVRNRLHLEKGSRMALSLKGFAEGFHPPLGDYLIIGAAHIMGELPTLVITGWPAGAGPLPALVNVDEGRGIALRVKDVRARD